jgi:hypothetical protein
MEMQVDVQLQVNFVPKISTETIKLRPRPKQSNITFLIRDIKQIATNL